MPIPTIYQADSEELSRKQALANALMQQSLSPIETQSVNGIPAPISPLQGLAKIFQGYVGNKKQQEIIDAQKQLAMGRAQGIDSSLGTSPDLLANALQGNNQNQSLDTSQQPMRSMEISPTQGIMQKYQRAVAMGDDPAAKFYEKQLELMKPVALREGDLVQVDPRTGNATSLYQQPKMEAGVLPTRNAAGQVTGAQGIPGYGPSAAQAKYPAEYAAASLKPTTVNAASGPYMTNEAQASGAPNPMTPGLPGGQSQAKPGVPLITPQQSEAQKGYGQNLSELEKELGTKSTASLTTIRTLDEMSDLAKNFDTGKLSGLKADISAYMQANLPKQVADSFGQSLKEVGSAQDMAKLTSQLAGAQVKEVGNRPMLIEFQTFLKANPGIEMTPYGFERMVDFMKRASMENINKYQNFRDYVKTNPNGTRADFETTYNKNLIDEMNKRYSTQQPSSSPSKITGDQDYANLSSGSIFIGPDGKTRRKP